MIKFVNKMIDFYHKGDISFYISLLGPFIMGTFHLVFSIIKFDWIVFNYCIFFYLMLLTKVWLWTIDKFQIRPNIYVGAIISLIAVILPMMASFVQTIIYKDTPHYLIDWFIYAYAFYGTIKLIFAIKNLTKKDKTDKQYILSFIGMISALYTLKMMEFSLIMTFSDGFSYSMYLIQLFTQGAIFLFSIFVIAIFIHKYISNKKKKNSEKHMSE